MFCVYLVQSVQYAYVVKPVEVKQRPLKRKCRLDHTVLHWLQYSIIYMVEVKRKYCLHVKVKHGVTAGNIYSGLNPDASTLNNKCFPFFLNFVSVFLCL